MADHIAAQDTEAAGSDGQLTNPTSAAAVKSLQTTTGTQAGQSSEPAAEQTQSTAKSPNTVQPSHTDKSPGDAHLETGADQEEVKLLHLEAAAAVKEISFAVRHAYKSTILTSTDQTIYINVQTKEECTLCLELSLQGFRVVGHKFDEIDSSCYSRHYETIYALLDDVSVEYRQSFGETLQNRLEALAIEQRAEEALEEE